jgi:hypothetical protein
VSRAIPQVLVRNRDDQVGLYYLSLNRMEHYPNGERKRDDVPDLSNNVRVDYSIFGTTYTVGRLFFGPAEQRTPPSLRINFEV